MSLLFQKSKGCSQCCEGTLEMKGALQAPSIDEAKTDNPESAAYYECDRCGFKVKESADGRTEIPDNDEWNQYCEQSNS